MEFKNILNNGAKLFGGLLLTYQLGCSSSEAIREKTNVESSEEKKELKLKPYHLRGDLEYLVTDLNTGDVQKGIPIAYGPIKAIEKGAYYSDRPDSLLETNFFGIDHLENIIEEFRKINPNLKDELEEFRKENGIPSYASSGSFKRLFFDGELNKDELERLEDGVYLFEYFAETDKDTTNLPGILLMKHNERKKSKKEGIKDTVKAIAEKLKEKLQKEETELLPIEWYGNIKDGALH